MSTARAARLPTAPARKGPGRPRLPIQPTPATPPAPVPVAVREVTVTRFVHREVEVLLWDARQLGLALSVPESTAAQYIREERYGPRVSVGRHLRVRKADVERTIGSIGGTV